MEQQTEKTGGGTKLLEQLRRAIRLRHPRETGEREIMAFLTYLAVKKNVVASTQNQALSALLFLYRKALELPFEWLDEVVRTRRPKRLPSVLSRDEVVRRFDALSGIPQLIARLMYGPVCV